jgi:NDP-sugar pyrophosphorylase family protein
LIREVSDPINIAFSTIHIINPALFRVITERGRFSIIDVYLRLAQDYTITGFEHDDTAWFECGRLDNLEKLNQTPEILSIYNECHQGSIRKSKEFKVWKQE